MKLEKKTDEILFATFVKLFRNGRTKTDNPVFRLHYYVANLIILGCLFVYTMFSYNHPVVCRFSSDANDPDKPKKLSWIPDDVLNEVCWNDKIFSLVVGGTNLSSKEYAFDNPMNIPASGNNQINEKESENQHTYHWIPGIMMFQMMTFFLPRFLWKKLFEGNKMKDLLKDFSKGVTDIGMVLKNVEGQDILTEYLANSFRTNANRTYASTFIFCEVLNVICVLFQLFGLDYISGYNFSNLGFQMILFTMAPLQDRTDELANMFPVNTRCNFTDIGGTQENEEYGGNCVIPTNMMVEQYFIVMWIFLQVLLVIGSIQLIFRAATVLSMRVRCYVLYQNVIIYPAPAVFRLVKRLSYGEWFILNQIGNNIHPWFYGQLIDAIASRIGIEENKEIG